MTTTEWSPGFLTLNDFERTPNMFDAILLTQSQLEQAHREVCNELNRRCPALPVDAKDIKGQETPKRALAVALAGNHSILFIGPHGTGKSMLRSVGRSLGLVKSYEALPCACGYLHEPRCNCSCVVDEINAYRRNQWPTGCDLFIEAPSVPIRELQTTYPGTSSAQIKESADRAMAFIARLKKKPNKLDADSEASLKNAGIELGMSPRQVATSVDVAGTIAAMDESEAIRTQHICEAINYRFPVFG
jgi:predicted ATPase with chaperone activity